MIASCKLPKAKEEAPVNNFDRTGLLKSAYLGSIQPSYDQLKASADSLQIYILDFDKESTPINLQKVKTQWISLAKHWQVANVYNFGPATNFEYATLLNNIGTFPASSLKIENYISSNDASLNNFARDSRGIYGIEYLIFAEDELTTVNNFTTNTNATSRKTYLIAICNDVCTNINKVLEGWNSFQGGFVSDNSTNSTSGITSYYNAFLISYENIKNYKIGIPAGKRAAQIEGNPMQAEAYYSKNSIPLMIINFQAVKRIWNGDNLDGTKGIGFEDYIKSADGGQTLVDNTINSFHEIETKLKALENEDYTTLINNKDTRLDELNTLFNNTTRYIKSDMSSLLGLTITYSSGDGD